MIFYILKLFLIIEYKYSLEIILLVTKSQYIIMTNSAVIAVQRVFQIIRGCQISWNSYVIGWIGRLLLGSNIEHMQFKDIIIFSLLFAFTLFTFITWNFSIHRNVKVIVLFTLVIILIVVLFILLFLANISDLFGQFINIFLISLFFMLWFMICNFKKPTICIKYLHRLHLYQAFTRRPPH